MNKVTHIEVFIGTGEATAANLAAVAKVVREMEQQGYSVNVSKRKVASDK